MNINHTCTMFVSLCADLVTSTPICVSGIFTEYIKSRIGLNGLFLMLSHVCKKIIDSDNQLLVLFQTHSFSKSWQMLELNLKNLCGFKVFLWIWIYVKHKICQIVFWIRDHNSKIFHSGPQKAPTWLGELNPSFLCSPQEIFQNVD